METMTPTLVQFERLMSDSKAFRTAAMRLEQDAQHVPSGQAKIGRWSSRTVWESLKAASHFNFQIAFELGLKACLVACNGSYPPIHKLRVLYCHLPKASQEALDDRFYESVRPHRIPIEGFIHERFDPPPPQEDIPIRTLDDCLEFLDDKAHLELKRFEWERLNNKEWVYVIHNLEGLIVFLRQLEAFSRDTWEARDTNEP